MSWLLLRFSCFLQALAESPKHGLAGIVFGGLVVKLGLLALGE